MSDWQPAAAKLGFAHVYTETSMRVEFVRLTPVGEYRATVESATIFGADGKTSTRQHGRITAVDNFAGRAIPVRGVDLDGGDLAVFARVIDRLASDRSKRIARRDRNEKRDGG